MPHESKDITARDLIFSSMELVITAPPFSPRPFLIAAYQ